VPLLIKSMRGALIYKAVPAAGGTAMQQLQCRCGQAVCLCFFTESLTCRDPHDLASWVNKIE